MARDTFESQPTQFAESDRLLRRSVDELRLGVRALNILKGADIRQIGDLVRTDEKDLLKTPQLAREALKEIKKALASRGLALRPHPYDGPSGG